MPEVPSAEGRSLHTSVLPRHGGNMAVQVPPPGKVLRVAAAEGRMGKLRESVGVWSGRVDSVRLKGGG